MTVKSFKQKFKLIELLIISFIIGVLVLYYSEVDYEFEGDFFSDLGFVIGTFFSALIFGFIIESILTVVRIKQNGIKK